MNIMENKTIEQQLFDKLERLMIVVDNLKTRIDTLERHQRVTQPYFIPQVTPNTQPLQWSITQCTKCGLQLDKVMSYCCSQPDCPTGLGPVMCDASN